MLIRRQYIYRQNVKLLKWVCTYNISIVIYTLREAEDDDEITKQSI